MDLFSAPPEHLKNSDLTYSLDYFLNLLRASGASEKTVLSYKSAIEDFLEFSSVKKLSDINPGTVVNWVNSRLKKGGKSVVEKRRTQVTMHYYTMFVRRWLNWLGLPKEFVPVVKKPSSSEISALTEDEVERLISASRDLKDVLIVSLLFETGLRANELLSITKNDVNVEGKEVTVKNAKYGKERVVFLGEISSEAVKRRIEEMKANGEDRLVDLSYNGLYKRLKSLARRAGLDESKVRPHVLRHTFATVAIRRGVSLPALQRILGHSDIKVTQIYMHLVKDDLKREYEEKFSKNREQNRRPSSSIELKPNTNILSYCPYCGNKIIPGSKFCPYCGAKLPVEETAPEST